MTRTRDAALYAFGLLLQQGVAVTSGIVAARWIGPGLYGEASLARAAYGVLVIVAPLGLDLALLRHLGEGRRSWPERRAEVARLRRTALAANLLVLLAAALAGPWLQAHVWRHDGFALQLLVALAGLPFAADLAILTAMARALHRTAPASLVTLYLQTAVRTGALALLLVLGAGALGLLAATVAGLAVADGALAAALARAPRPAEAPSPLPATAPPLSTLLRYSGWMAAMLLAYQGLKLMDVLALGAVRPAREVGSYAAASAVAQLVAVYPMALSQTLGPSVAAHSARRDRAAVRAELARYARRASLLAAPLFAGVAVFGPWLDLLFGARFRFDPALCALLAAGAYVSGVFGPMSASLSMTGRHRLEFAILLAGACLSLCGCLWLAPAWGGAGAAAATLAGYLLVNGARTAVSARIMGGLDLGRGELVTPLACLGVAAAWRAAAERLGGHDLSTVAWVAPGAAASLAALYLGVLLRPEERRALSAPFRRRRTRSAALAAPCRS